MPYSGASEEGGADNEVTMHCCKKARARLLTVENGQLVHRGNQER